MLGMQQIIVYGIGAILFLIGLTAVMIDSRLSVLSKEANKKSAISGLFIFIISIILAIGIVYWGQKQATTVHESVTRQLQNIFD